MKIHKLKIENIASLKGEHLVDFDQFQMDFGSFAITGDTGAGKSTILNCISLALYGKNYRKGIIPTDLITLGESVGRVELIFSSSGNVYHRIWECRVRKKNGEYLKKPVPQNEFYLVQGDKKEVLDIAPEDVIHLTFDQFCKTIILNQGQFSKFLTSGFKDRKDILEKLYHGEKLNGFNPLLREKINALIAGTEQIEAEMSGLTQNFHPDITQEGLKNVEAAHQKAQKVFSFMQELSCDLKDTCSLSS
ncbi:MAG: SMC family ATPase, partial [Bacteriovoracaceae bacterium]